VLGGGTEKAIERFKKDESNAWYASGTASGLEVRSPGEAWAR